MDGAVEVEGTDEEGVGQGEEESKEKAHADDVEQGGPQGPMNELNGSSE